MSMPPRLGALLAIVFWGVSFAATRHVVTEISPETLIFTRALLGGGMLVALLVARREPIAPPRDSWPSLWLMAFVGVVFHQLLQAYALRLTTAAHTGWLIGLTPIWSALLAVFLLGERLGLQKTAGLLLGFCGALVVMAQGGGAAALALPSTRGDLMILLSTLNWAVYTVIGHDVIRRLGATKATTWALTLGCVMLLPVFVWARGWEDWARLSPAGVLAVLFLGIACSGLGYLFWYAALEKIETAKVASLLYLEPIVTLVSAAVLLREPIELRAVIGGLLLIAGVVLVQRAPEARRSPASS